MSSQACQTANQAAFKEKSFFHILMDIPAAAKKQHYGREKKHAAIFAWKKYGTTNRINTLDGKLLRL